MFSARPFNSSPKPVSGAVSASRALPILLPMVSVPMPSAARIIPPRSISPILSFTLLAKYWIFCKNLSKPFHVSPSLIFTSVPRSLRAVGIDANEVPILEKFLTTLFLSSFTASITSLKVSFSKDLSLVKKSSSGFLHALMAFLMAVMAFVTPVLRLASAVCTAGIDLNSSIHAFIFFVTSTIFLPNSLNLLIPF